MPARQPVATIGLHGSASTWVFNVVRELLVAAVGTDRVLAFYAEDIHPIPDETARTDPWLVIKSHCGNPRLDAWLQARSATLILSLRDPRDAALSLMRRFDMPLEQSVRAIGMDCARLMRLAGQAPLLLRFEDGFFDDPATIGAIARALGLQPTEEAAMRIFDRYRTEAVRQFAQALQQDHAGGGTAMDPLTQIHATHIGDGRIGKWRDLPVSMRKELSGFFAPFLDRFGYADEP